MGDKNSPRIFWSLCQHERLKWPVPTSEKNGKTIGKSSTTEPSTNETKLLCRVIAPHADWLGFFAVKDGGLGGGGVIRFALHCSPRQHESAVHPHLVHHGKKIQHGGMWWRECRTAECSGTLQKTERPRGVRRCGCSFIEVLFCSAVMGGK